MFYLNDECRLLQKCLVNCFTSMPCAISSGLSTILSHGCVKIQMIVILFLKIIIQSTLINKVENVNYL